MSEELLLEGYCINGENDKTKGGDGGYASTEAQKHAVPQALGLRLMSLFSSLVRRSHTPAHAHAHDQTTAYHSSRSNCGS
jgi:hypothetical protein